MNKYGPKPLDFGITGAAAGIHDRARDAAGPHTLTKNLLLNP